MKKLLRELAKDNFTYYQVWSYLWLSADDNNRIEFNYLDICNKFKVSKSTMTRIMQYVSMLNMDKLFVEVTTSNSNVIIKFYNHGKPNRTKISDFDSESLKYLSSYYEKLNFDYPELRKHLQYLILITDKIRTSMTRSGREVTDETLRETFEGFFTNIPQWWIDNGHIKLTMLTRKYSEIVQQIRNTKKNEYASKIQATEHEDYSGLVKARN